MLKEILAISGRQGLYKIISRGKNSFIVESLVDKKRRPAYATDHISSLADVAIYTTGADDKPLPEVFEAIKVKNEGKPLDLASLKEGAVARKYFAEILPEFDEDRVHNSDINKVYTWYNILINAGITEFKEPEKEAEKPEEKEAKKAEEK